MPLEGLTIENAPWWGTKSYSVRDVHITIMGSNPPETLTIPLEVHTKVLQVKYMVAQKLGIDDMSSFQFVVKNSTSYKTLINTDEIQAKVSVRGIKSWVREKWQYPHPICIIGAGHNGLRQALSFNKEGIGNYVVYDRLDQLAGIAWVTNANPTSKLQTEKGVYHLQYDPDYEIPKAMSTWPARGELLKHFKDTCDEFGITPHVKLNRSVLEISVIINDKTMHYVHPQKQQYNLISTRTGDITGRSEEETSFSAVAMYPGALTKPIRLEFKGEDVFEGQLGYGMSQEFDYTKVKDQVASVIGMGAFAVENIRTCLEHSAEKCYLICRRKNIAMPRVISWWINQSIFPAPGGLMMDAMCKMYDLIPDDPWSYYAVNANKDKTAATIRQKSRFGIGDVYFLACHYGKAECIVDEVKRLKQTSIILESGAKVDTDHVVKVLGYYPDSFVDKLMGVKEMVGYFVNGDWRRWIWSESPGVDAGKFGGTSLSPGAIQVSETYSWCLNYPKDLIGLFDSQMLPKNKADLDKGKVAYVWDQRTGATVSMTMSGGIIPGLAELGALYGPLNRAKQLEAHPLEKFIDECTEDWNNYCKMFQKPGDDRPFPKYPYTKEFVRKLVEDCDAEGQADADRQAARAARR